MQKEIGAIPNNLLSKYLFIQKNWIRIVG